MRKTLLIAALSLGCIAAQAQKIEIGLNGGMVLHKASGKGFSGPPSAGPTVNGDLMRSPIGSYGSAKVSVILKNWQAGIGIDKFRTEIRLNYPLPLSLRNGDPMHYNLTPYLFGNRLFRLPKSFAYAGINGGICNGKSITPTDVSSINLEARYSGFFGGVQAGYTFYFIKHFGVNAELGARYQQVKYDYTFNTEPTVSQLVFPVSLGVRYSL